MSDVLSSIKDVKVEDISSNNVEIVIGTRGIMINNGKNLTVKNDGVKGQYYLNVEQIAEVHEGAQFLTIQDDCADDNTEQQQYVAVQMDGSDQIILQDKDIVIELCRICANGSDRFVPIFNGQGLEHDLQNKIQTYLPLQILESDSLPLQICYNCAETLLAWHDMHKGCLNAQDRLMELQNKFNFKTQCVSEPLVEEDDIMEKEEVLENEEVLNSEEPEAQSGDTTREESVQVVDITESDRCKGLELKKTCKPSHAGTELSSICAPPPPPPTPSNIKLRRTLRARKSSRSKVAERSESADVEDDSLKEEPDDEDSSSEEDGEASEEMPAEGESFGSSSKGKKSARKKGARRAGAANLQCEQCLKKFRMLASYQIHMRIHSGERPYTCHICGKQFGQTGSLYYHLKHVHGGVKNHACDICGRCFAMKTAMEDHRRIHTGERPYVCDSCGKTFKTKASLYIHSKIHTNEYPFKCTYCKKLFRWKQQMISHLTTHTGEKNHVCDVCGKGFGVKNELTRHSRTHSLDKPFTCLKCGLSFGQKRYLTNHNRTRHNNKIITPT